MLFVGDDWAEAHHDIEVQDEAGRRLARRRLPEGVAGITALHELIGAHVGGDIQGGGQGSGQGLDDPGRVVIGIETDRGPWVRALLAAGYQVFAINPMSVARYRERRSTSGAKSDAGDAHVLADLVRTDRHAHRPIAGDSELAEAVKVLARAHQGVGWLRGRQVNMLRSTLREFYPGALQAFDELTSTDALAVLQIAPTPAGGRTLSHARIVTALRRGGRRRNLDARAEHIRAALRAPQLEQPQTVSDAYGHVVLSYVHLLTASIAQVNALQEELQACFGRHPDAELVLSQPGLGTVLGARVLAEFGDDPDRYTDTKARKNYAGMSPITKASGTRRVVLARYARNRRLADALYLQAFAALSGSPGARAYYDSRRQRGATHHQALRALANRLVGILHGCLRHHRRYDETIAWNHHHPAGSAEAA